MKIIKTEQDAQDFWALIPDESSSFWPAISTDFNGVLDTYSFWPGYVKDWDPAEGVEEFLQNLRERFSTLIVFTATIPLDSVAQWLKRYDLAKYVDFLSAWKLPSSVYIDDKAVCHRGNFSETLREVDNFKPHWEK